MLGKVVIGLLFVVGAWFFIAALLHMSPEVNDAPTLVGAACFIGIFARVIQAEIHQHAMLKVAKPRP
jgi:threonine/homoserine/homoserine lactone efflux protein